jgi:hypothetical protein
VGRPLATANLEEESTVQLDLAAPTGPRRADGLAQAAPTTGIGVWVAG